MQSHYAEGRNSIPADDQAQLISLHRETGNPSAHLGSVTPLPRPRAAAVAQRILGTSRPLKRLLEHVALVAPTDAPVLITGESGTGKELLATALHRESIRAHMPMVRVNCGAIPRELFESEFFGHVKGAFTGALRDRVGRFEAADGGTLFLDEVSEIPLDLQAKLLRALQEGEVERVGDHRLRRVDVRILAATNRDLAAAVRAGNFREDLYFRLNVIPLKAPALRERQADIALLAEHFVGELDRKLGNPPRSLSGEQIRSLLTYAWPGNIRELRNVIERSVILSGNGCLELTLPADETIEHHEFLAPTPLSGLATEEQRKAQERQNIIAALDQCAGKVYGSFGAAALLGLKPTTLASRIKALRIEKPRNPKANRQWHISPCQLACS